MNVYIYGSLILNGSLIQHLKLGLRNRTEKGHENIFANIPESQNERGFTGFLKKKPNLKEGKAFLGTPCY